LHECLHPAQRIEPVMPAPKGQKEAADDPPFEVVRGTQLWGCALNGSERQD
jgi:hypothetical protein